MPPSRKQQVVDLLKSLETKNLVPFEYVNPNKYIQHNLQVGPGLEGVAALIQNMPPDASVNTIRVFEDGDYVFAHTEYNFFGPKAGFDIFRFEDGLVVEHWDNLQETATEPSPSGHTMIDGPTAVSDLDQTQANKALMQRYMDDLLAGRRETFPSYFNGIAYIQHNPWVADTIPGLIAGLQALAAKGQAVVYKRVHMALGEGNFVLVVAEATFGGVPTAIVMAPLTRMRAQSHDHVPTTLQAEHYAQRASAGLIITEATAVSPEGFGWADTPDLWTQRQVTGWRRVTDAVHAAGGRIIAQLWHTGAISHPALLDGAQPVSASNVDPGQISVTPTGKKPTVTPRPLTKQEIRVTVADFARAARNAMEAGFDGVQVLANYLYLISQFLNATTNRRKDEYGGSLENRSRLLFEIVEAVLNEVDAKRVGVKISPMHEGGAFAANDETLPITEYAIQRLNEYNLSHLLLMGNTTDFSGSPLERLADDGMFRHFRPLFNGTLIASVKMDRDRGNRLIAEDLADLIAFGRPYIANPDLVQRFAENAPLAEVDWETVYGAGPHGYSDYPTYQSSEHNPRS